MKGPKSIFTCKTDQGIVSFDFNQMLGTGYRGQKFKIERTDVGAAQGMAMCYYRQALVSKKLSKILLVNET